MGKTNTNSVAESNENADADTTEATTTKVIAEWKGSDRSPRLDGATARVITKKEAKNGLLMDLTKDLRWGHETAYRADITEEPPAFREWLEKSGEFKVTEE